MSTEKFGRSYDYCVLIIRELIVTTTIDLNFLHNVMKPAKLTVFELGNLF